MSVDMVNAPPHYIREGAPEAIEIIEAAGYGLHMCLATAMKYILRHQFKGKPEQDLEKSLWYLKRAFKTLNSAGGHRPVPSFFIHDQDMLRRAFKLSDQLLDSLDYIVEAGAEHNTTKARELVLSAIEQIGLHIEIEFFKAPVDA